MSQSSLCLVLPSRFTPTAAQIPRKTIVDRLQRRARPMDAQQQQSIGTIVNGFAAQAFN